MFAGCLASVAGKSIVNPNYIKEQVSDIQRKNGEAIALQFGEAPRTLQRFLESIKWNEEELRAKKASRTIMRTKKPLGQVFSP